MNKDSSSTYCVMPHMGLAVQNHADFCCCNINKQSWKNSKLQTMHVYDHALQDTFQSHTRKIIAAVLDNGQRHKSCQPCWDLEDAGGSSTRTMLNQRFGHLAPLQNQPRILILKPGNTCNFACRMCNPMTSSSWYADGYALEQNNLHSTSWYENQFGQSETQAMTFNQYARTFEHIRKSFNGDNADFWSALRDWLPNLDFVDIYGGEPFLTPALFEWLEHGINDNASAKISLRIHTNASVFNQRYIEILREYQHVDFKVSIDSDDPRQLEYIRHKADFDTVISNTLKFKDFFSGSKNIDFGVTMTLTPLNVYDLDRIVENLSTILMLPITVNIVTTPEYDIRHIPKPVKQMLISKTKNIKVTKFLEQTILGSDTEWSKFCQATDMLDRLRGQSFSEVFSDWWQELEPYWVAQ